MNQKSRIGPMTAAILLTVAAATAQAATGNPTHPAIAHYGGIHPRPNAAEQPSPKKHYKVVFDISKHGKAKDQPNPALDVVARQVNIFASAGVPLDYLNFVAVIRGPATASVLTDAAYTKQFGHKNPNTPLIAALHKAGVKVEVCGQALAGHKYPNNSVNPKVTIALSAFSTFAIYEKRGYAYEKP